MSPVGGRAKSDASGETRGIRERERSVSSSCTVLILGFAPARDRGPENGVKRGRWGGQSVPSAVCQMVHADETPSRLLMRLILAANSVNRLANPLTGFGDQFRDCPKEASSYGKKRGNDEV